jgi:hypothetical protein
MDRRSPPGIVLVGMVQVVRRHHAHGGVAPFADDEFGVGCVTVARRYLGSWTLPSGNSCNVYLTRDPLTPGTLVAGLACEWDTPPSSAWPAEDVTHFNTITFPEIVRAIATVTGQRVLGVTP